MSELKEVRLLNHISETAGGNGLFISLDTVSYEVSELLFPAICTFDKLEFITRKIAESITAIENINEPSGFTDSKIDIYETLHLIRGFEPILTDYVYKLESELNAVDETLESESYRNGLINSEFNRITPAYFEKHPETTAKNSKKAIDYLEGNNKRLNGIIAELREENPTSNTANQLVRVVSDNLDAISCLKKIN